MINNHYQPFRPTTSYATDAFGGCGFRSSVPSNSLFTNFNHNSLETKTTSCPIGQSQVVQQLTSLHSLLVEYLNQQQQQQSTTNHQCHHSPNHHHTNTSPNHSKSLSLPSTTATSTSPQSSSLACDFNLTNSYSSETGGTNSPRTTTSSAVSYSNISLPQYLIQRTGSPSPSSPSSPRFSNGSSSTSSSSEYEGRITRLEQLVKQTLSLIYRGDYKSPPTTTTSVVEPIKQSVATKIKEIYQLDMEPLKQIVATVVHNEPKRCNMGYDIIYQMKTELAFLSQLCK